MRRDDGPARCWRQPSSLLGSYSAHVPPPEPSGGGCSDLGDPSRLFGWLAWLPPQLRFRSLISAANVMSLSSPASIMASCASPGLYAGL